MSPSERSAEASMSTSTTTPQLARRPTYKNTPASFTVGNDFLGDHLGQLLGRHPNSAQSTAEAGQRRNVARVEEEDRDFLGSTIASASRSLHNNPTSPESSRHGSSVTMGRRGSIMSVRNMSNEGRATYTIHGSPFADSAPADQLFGSFFSDRGSVSQSMSPKKAQAPLIGVALQESEESKAAGGSKKADSNNRSAKRIPLDRRSSSFVFNPSRRPKKSSSSNASPDHKSRSDCQSDASSVLGREMAACTVSDRQSTGSCRDDAEERRSSSLNTSEVASTSSTPVSSLQTYDPWQTQHLSSRLTVSTMPTSESDALSSQGGDKWSSSRNGSLDSANGNLNASDEANTIDSDKLAASDYTRALQHFRNGGVIEPPEAEQGPESLALGRSSFGAVDMLKPPTFTLSHATAVSPSLESSMTTPTTASHGATSTALTSASSRFTSMTSTRGSFSSSDPRKNLLLMTTGGSVATSGSAVATDAKSTAVAAPARSSSTEASDELASSLSTITRHIGGERLVPKGGSDDDGRTFVFVSR